MLNKKTLKDVTLKDRRVLVRADFNVPLADGRVRDDNRLVAALPTLRHLLKSGAGLALCSHLGRPGGKVVDDLRMDPVGNRLSELLNLPVRKLDNCAGPEAEAAKAGLKPGEVILLENTRFHPGEKDNDPMFARRLADGVDLFVNDAFGTAHRAHASTVGVAEYLPGVAGILMERELTALEKLRDRPETPVAALLGGAKVADKIGVVERLLEMVDVLLIGGAMGITFLKAAGADINNGGVEESALDNARDLLDRAGDRIVLPTDLVVAPELAEDVETRTVTPGQVPKGWQVGDIGPKTVDAFTEHLLKARAVIWNGPLGVFEIPSFNSGTRGMGRRLAEIDADVYVGGGDTAAAVKDIGVAEQMAFISTGGGAFLKFLEGKTLPAVAALADRSA
ncbi:MAG: phosphoglycerate kinase [Desulfococcaceae bacterium]